MASGQWFVRELKSSDTPDELCDRALMRLTPELKRARYELIARDAHMIRYRRRYLPTLAMVLGLLLTAVAAYRITGWLHADRAMPWAILAVGLLGVGLLALVRRSEVVILTVTARPGGSRALVAGHVNDRARLALRTWSPPVRPNLRCITHSGVRSVPPARSVPSPDR
jgi:hypothetical protein